MMMIDNALQDVPERLCLRLEARMSKLGCDASNITELHAAVFEGEATWITKKLDINRALYRCVVASAMTLW